ncbi:CTB family bacteriocin [Nostoc sp. NMS8]|uniref:CTB family bacteriocin n=1 Tax=Nostoc sp. NMS8 TaxID=2815392 RepID=UPI0025F1B331|nr:CTB family bacteriocin [Nostoc sp. NMS8]
MSDIKNILAVELSEGELDTLAGGLAITFGDVQGFASDANNTFSQKNLTVGQQTFAGPNGSGTASLTNVQEIFSSAGQAIAVG